MNKINTVSDSINQQLTDLMKLCIQFNIPCFVSCDGHEIYKCREFAREELKFLMMLNTTLDFVLNEKPELEKAEALILSVKLLFSKIVKENDKNEYENQTETNPDIIKALESMLHQLSRAAAQEEVSLYAVVQPPLGGSCVQNISTMVAKESSPQFGFIRFADDLMNADNLSQFLASLTEELSKNILDTVH